MLPEIKTKLLRGVILDSAKLMGIVPKEKQLAAVSSFVQGRDICVFLHHNLVAPLCAR